MAIPQSLLIKALAILLVISVIIGIVLYRKNGTLFFFAQKNSNEVLVTFGPVPLSALYRVDLKKKTITPYTLEGKADATLKVIDAVAITKNSHYYLLAEASKPFVTNLYLEDEKGALTKLTDTATYKQGLSYEGQIGVLVYRSREIKEASDFESIQGGAIEVFNTLTKKVTTVGRGKKAFLLSSGKGLLIQDSLSLSLISIKDPNKEINPVIKSASSTPKKETSKVQTEAPTNKPFVYMKLLPDSLVAVDAIGERVAQYNKITKAVDFYSFKNNSLTYVESEGKEITPQAMNFLGSDLLLTSKVNKNNISNIVFKKLPESSPIVLSVPAELAEFKGVQNVITPAI